MFFYIRKTRPSKTEIKLLTWATINLVVYRFKPSETGGYHIKQSKSERTDKSQLGDLNIYRKNTEREKNIYIYINITWK